MEDFYVERDLKFRTVIYLLDQTVKNHVISLILATTFGSALAEAENRVAYDIDMAKEICSELPLESVEGIWIYPEDGVSVLILNSRQDEASTTRFPEYTISVVETTDARLHPGDVIGRLSGSADPKVFNIELVTEKKNDVFLKARTCTATLNNEGDAFVFKKGKSGIKGRLNFNFNRLLPGFWKVISTGITTSPGNNNVEAPVGMIKIYPSYDGNGSSRRKPRYL